jgi:hypothetical protein
MRKRRAIEKKIKVLVPRILNCSFMPIRNKTTDCQQKRFGILVLIMIAQQIE